MIVKAQNKQLMCLGKTVRSKWQTVRVQKEVVAQVQKQREISQTKKVPGAKLTTKQRMAQTKEAR